MKRIREAKFSNKFYSADKTELLRSVELCLNSAGPELGVNKNHVRGLMLPHAGYVYSGSVAGATLQYAFGAVLDEDLDDADLSFWRMPDTFIILCPNHTGRGVPVAVWPDGLWRTPLGELEVDEQITSFLLDKPDALFSSDLLAHENEHSIEVILPFLQVLQPGVKIVPICLGSYNYAHLVELGTILAELVESSADSGKELCLLASSDMSHYLPEAEGGRLDTLALERMARLDSRGFFGTVVEKKISMCGFAGVTAMLAACQRLGKIECVIPARSNSGVASRQMGHPAATVVGYAGAVFRDKSK